MVEAKIDASIADDIDSIGGLLGTGSGSDVTFANVIVMKDSFGRAMDRFGIDAEAEYAAARTGLAELALSGCTTVFDHHYVFPRGESGLVEAEVQAARELGCRIVASRGSMDLGVSDGGLPPEALRNRSSGV